MSGVQRSVVLFGNLMLWGQERANIDALYALKQTGCEVLFLVRKEHWAEPLRRELSQRGLKWVVAPFITHRIGRRMSAIQILQSFRSMMASSLVLIRLIRRWQPTHIHVANPVWFFSFLPVLLLTKIPVIYNIGDEPGSSHYGWHLLWRFIFSRVTQFVIVSHYIEYVLVTNGVPTDKIKVIYGRPPVRLVPASRFALYK